MPPKTRRIVFVLTYPSYHSVADPAEWLRWNNRDRRMPGLLAAMGADVELWALGRTSFDEHRGLDDLPPYRIRLFPPDSMRGPTREHRSSALAAAAARDPADLFVLIGTDGGAGLHLFDRVLKPDGRRFAVIIGGGYWSRIVPHAALVLPESAVQERLLVRPGRRWWRRPIPRERMLRLPKFIDTERFRPIAAEKEFDIIAVSRLMRYKHLDEVGVLSQSYRIAVAGSGPQEPMLRRRFPNITWLGHVPHAAIPAALARARLFVHAGRRDYFPRAIVEAMACGLPAVAFDGRIGPDVLPPQCGLLVNGGDYMPRIASLLADPDRIATMGSAARDYVVATHGPFSSREVCARLLSLAP